MDDQDVDRLLSRVAVFERLLSESIERFVFGRLDSRIGAVTLTINKRELFADLDAQSQTRVQGLLDQMRKASAALSAVHPGEEQNLQRRYEAARLMANVTN